MGSKQQQQYFGNLLDALLSKRMDFEQQELAPEVRQQY